MSELTVLKTAALRCLTWESLTSHESEQNYKRKKSHVLKKKNVMMRQTYLYIMIRF